MTHAQRLVHLVAAAAVALPGAAIGAPATAPVTPPVTPATVLAAAPAADWTEIDASDLLVIDLARGGRVVIALAGDFAPVHVANIRALALAHWYDGLVIERVQDNYVTQWGDPDGKKPLPAGVEPHPPPEYERAAAGLALAALPYSDPYAERVGVVGAFPVASRGEAAWLTHCYGMVGVGRDLNPDTGTGAELYAVIGQPARPLDRNIAVVGRVLAGMELLSALPEARPISASMRTLPSACRSRRSASRPTCRRRTGRASRRCGPTAPPTAPGST